MELNGAITENRVDLGGTISAKKTLSGSLSRPGNPITVDDALSDTSENPVQNKVVKAALDAKGTYSKPSGGIPASDLAQGAIPTVPTKTSDLTNDSGFVNAAGAAAAAPVKSVNGQTGAVTVQPASDAQVETAVDAWLNENISQETGYVLDRTLSLANAAAPADLVIDKTGIGGVTPQNLQIVNAVMSPNLIDETKIIDGKYITKNGAEHNGSYCVTDFIPVEAGEDYYFTWYYVATRSDASLRFFACYDANKTPIPSAGSDTMIKTFPIHIADGVAFVRLSTSNNTNYNRRQFEKGDVPTDYHPYGELLDAEIDRQYIPDVEMSQIPAFHLVEGQNLWNKNDPDLQPGKFLYITGAVSDNSGYTTGGFIEVSPGDSLVGSYQVSTGMGRVEFRTVAAYDADKTAISASGKYSVKEYIVPDGIAYVRICVSSGYGENIQIQKLASDESYYPYREYEAPHYELDPDYMFQNPAHPVYVFLPKDIYVAVGRTIELYNEQIVLDHEKYHFRWGCGKGAAYQRKFSITGTTVGDLGLSLELYDDKKTLCWCGRSTIHVVAANNPSKKILPIGDSLTNWKAWLQETMLLSNGSITFVGTRYSGQSVDSEGNIYASGSIHHEGRSGWAADSYLSDTEYTFDNRYDGAAGVSGSANPFWDGSKFSLHHYLTTQTGVSTPDAVQIFLGTNDLRNGVESAVTNITAMVASIRSEYADLPIFVCNTIFRSSQNGYGSTGNDAYAGGAGAGTWQYDEDSKVMDLAVGLRSSLANVTGVYFIPLASCMDREYGFGQVMTKVNPRSSVEVPMPAESVHPQASGYYQMADLMYSFYCGVLS